MHSTSFRSCLPPPVDFVQCNEKEETKMRIAHFRIVRKSNCSWLSFNVSSCAPSSLKKKFRKISKFPSLPPLSVCSLFNYTAQKKLITEQSSPIASIATVPWIWSAPSSHQTWEIRSNNFVVAAIRISQVPPGGLSPQKRYWQEHRPRGSDPKCRNVWKFIQNSGNRRIDTSDRARRNLASQRRLPTSTHAERKGKKKENWFI